MTQKGFLGFSSYAVSIQTLVVRDSIMVSIRRQDFVTILKDAGLHSSFKL